MTETDLIRSYMFHFSLGVVVFLSLTLYIPWLSERHYYNFMQNLTYRHIVIRLTVNSLRQNCVRGHPAF